MACTGREEGKVLVAVAVQKVAEGETSYTLSWREKVVKKKKKTNKGTFIWQRVETTKQFIQQ